MTQQRPLKNNLCKKKEIARNKKGMLLFMMAAISAGCKLADAVHLNICNDVTKHDMSFVNTKV